MKTIINIDDDELKVLGPEETPELPEITSGDVGKVLTASRKGNVNIPEWKSIEETPELPEITLEDVGKVLTASRNENVNIPEWKSIREKIVFTVTWDNVTDTASVVCNKTYEEVADLIKYDNTIGVLSVNANVYLCFHGETTVFFMRQIFTDTEPNSIGFVAESTYVNEELKYIVDQYVTIYNEDGTIEIQRLRNYE